MIDYHVHTRLCNHAEGAMEAYIKKAVDIGLEEICFLDHLTIRESEKQLSMTKEEVPFYFQAVKFLRQRYKKKIKVKVGLEIDFNPEYTDIFHEIVETYSFDVIGSSLHFLKGMDIVSRHSDWAHGKIDPDYVFGLYLEQLGNMLEYDYFDVICHIDLAKKFGAKPSRTFDGEFDTVLSKIKNRGLAVELNTSGYAHTVNEVYPAFSLLKKCYEKGISITLGSDAHNPESMGRRFDSALSMLRLAGYRRIATFSRRRQSSIPI